MYVVSQADRVDQLGRVHPGEGGMHAIRPFPAWSSSRYRFSVGCLLDEASDRSTGARGSTTYVARSIMQLADRWTGRPPATWLLSFLQLGSRLPEHASLTVRTQRACSSIDRFHPGTAPIHRQLSSYYLNYQQLYYEYVATACMRPVAFIFWKLRTYVYNMCIYIRQFISQINAKHPLTRTMTQIKMAQPLLVSIDNWY